MSTVSLETIRKTFLEAQKNRGVTVEGDTKKVSLETIRTTAAERKTQREKDVFSSIYSTSQWMTQRDMDKVIAKVQGFVADNTVDKLKANSILAYLRNRKNEFANFKSADEYNAAVKEAGFLEKHSGYTRADVQEATARLQKANTLAGVEGETDEIKWLKNYGMRVGYSDSESYVQEIAALDDEIAALDKQRLLSINPHDTRGNYLQNQKDELQQKRTELETKKAYFERKLKEVQAGEIVEQQYKPVTRAADFNQRSKADSSVSDTLYRHINDLPETFGTTFVKHKNATGIANDIALADEMEPEERLIYNYLFRGNKARADKYFDDMRPILNARLNKTQATNAKEFSDNHTNLANLLSLGTSLVDGIVMAPVKLLGSLTGDYEENWASYDTLTTFTNTIRTDTAQDLSNHYGTEWAGFIYNTVMSMCDMGVALAVGGIAGKAVGAASSVANTTKIAKGVTQFIMSSEAASQTMTDARQRGLSGWQIAGLGATSATIEWLTEKLPLDELFGKKPNYAKAFWKQIVTEGIEEPVSNLANTFFDEVIAGNQSALKQQIGDLMASGMSYQDAANKVLIDKVKEIGMDALAGALSGAIMGGGSVALNKLSTVHFSIPTKYKGDLSSAQTWVADKFQNLKGSVNKKGLGTVEVDSQSMTDAIHKTETADQAVAFAAINDIIHKGKVKIEKGGNVAGIGTIATFNGNTHNVVITVGKMNNGNFLVTGITLDAETVLYDIRNYMQQTAESRGDISTATIASQQLRGLSADELRNKMPYGEAELATAQKTLVSGIREVVASANVLVVDPGHKSIESIINKVMRKLRRGNYDFYTLKDHARAAVVVNSLEEVPAIVSALKQKFPGLTGEVFLETPLNKSGYRGIHLTIPLGNGLNAEIQITTQEAWKIKKQTDAIYEKWRNIEEYNMTDQQRAERQADYEQSARLWEDYYSGLAPEVIRMASDSVMGLESSHSPHTPLNGDHLPLTNSNFGDAPTAAKTAPVSASTEYSNGMSYPPYSNESINSIPNPKEIVNEDVGNSNSTDENEKIDFSVLGLEKTELDVSFFEMTEEERVDFTQRFESATGTRVVFDETLNTDGKYKDGVITVNPNKATPMTVLIHELTHHIEKHPKYADFFEYVFKSEMFASWLKEKGTTLQDLRRATIALRARDGHPLGASGDVIYEADQEILGYFLGQKVFRDMSVLSKLAEQHRGFFEKMRDIIANIIQYFRNTPMERELNKMQQMFSKVLHQKIKGTPSARPGEVKFSFGVTQSDIDDYVEKAYTKENEEDYKKYASVGEKLIADTQDQVDISFYSHALRDNDIRHINNSHGDGNPNEKYPVTKDDIKRIPEIVSNYDKVIVFEKSSSKKGLMYVKVAENGLVYYLEQITEKYGNEPLLVNKQMIKTGADDIPNLPGLKEAINKKQETAEFLADLRKARQVYAQSVHQQSLTDTTVPQNGDGVNTQYMQDGEKYSVSPVLDVEETQQEKSTSPETSEQTGMEQFTDEQLFEEMRRRNPRLSPLDIALLKPEDANTTPLLRNSTVQNLVGDGDSSFYDSLQNVDIFNDELKTLAASNSTIMQYDRIGNQETLRAANNEINRKGRRYVGEFLHKESTEFTAQDVAAGFILMGRYNAVGDYRGAVMIAEKLREVGTKSGQTVQAFSILGRLTPEGMQLYAQRELHKAYETMLKEQTNKWGRENKDKFKLTDEDIEFIRRKVVQAAQLPDGRDKYVRLAEIAARIQSKIPQQKGQSFKAWQRTAMLLNPKTQIRNITGNLFAMPQFIVSDFIGTGLDKMISKSTGVRTKSGVHLSAKAFAEGLFNSWDDFVRHINTRKFEGGRFEIEGHSLDNFSDRNAFTRALNKLDRFNSFLLEAGDRSFYQMWFVNSLNGQMKANHVTEPTAAMIELAADEALERTWQDDNKVSKSVSGLKRIMNNIHIGGYGLGDVVIKFSKTPANLTKAIFDFSPAGLVKALSADAYKFSQAVRDGKVTPQMQRTFVKNLSNGITGTLMTFIAMAVAKAGLLTGDKDEDKEVADFEKYVKGHQPYSVKMGNSSFTYDWAQPTAALMAIAADYFENKQNEELTGEAKGFVQNVIDAIQVGGQVLYNQSFMKSIQNLFGNDGFWSGLIDTIIQDPSAMLPQALSQVAAVSDPVIRNTYENDNETKTAINKILYKLPGARNTLAESVDVMGNTKMQHGSVWERIFNNFLNPANVAKGYDSAAADEVYRLYQVTGAASVIPSQAPNYVEVSGGGKRTLNSHEKAEHQKVTGKMITEAVGKLLENERYRELSDDTKVELLGKVYSYAKQAANNEVLGIEMNESAAKTNGVISQGVPLYEYFLLKQIADGNDNGSISQEEARKVLDASGLTKTQKSIMWGAFNSGWKYNPYGKRYY